MGLEGGDGSVEGEGGEGWDNVVGGRIVVDGEEVVIMFG